MTPPRAPDTWEWRRFGATVVIQPAPGARLEVHAGWDWRGCTVAASAAALLAGLKLSGVIGWPWEWALAPLWVTAMIPVCSVAVGLAACLWSSRVPPGPDR